MVLLSAPKLLYANGDSFTFGYELDEHEEFTEYKRKNCYSGIMAHHLNAHYKNASETSGSNQRVYRTVLQDIPELLKIYKPEDLFVLIGLSNSDRREYYHVPSERYYRYRNVPPKNDNYQPLWKSLTEYTSVKNDALYDMMMILGIQNFLIRCSIPYLITRAYMLKEHVQEFNNLLITDQLYRPRYYDETTFWKHTEHCPRAPGQHPLDDAHKLWADHLLSHIQKNNLFSNSDLH